MRFWSFLVGQTSGVSKNFPSDGPWPISCRCLHLSPEQLGPEMSGFTVSWTGLLPGTHSPVPALPRGPWAQLCSDLTHGLSKGQEAHSRPPGPEVSSSPSRPVDHGRGISHICHPFSHFFSVSWGACRGRPVQEGPSSSQKLFLATRT